MKIGLDGRAAIWYRGTGIGTYTYQLIKSINSLDNINSYTVFIPEGETLPINLENNFSTKQSSNNDNNNFWERISLPNILKETGIDIYHVPQNGVGIPTEKTCPFVMTLHDIIPYKMPETCSERYLKIFNELMPSLVKLCDGIITVSNYSKDDISSAFNYPKEKIFVTHLASEEMYKPIDKWLSKNLIKKFYGINDDYILYVGGFSPRKNIIGLIQAFSKLLTTYNPDIKLVIAGSKGLSYSKYYDECIRLKVEKNVIFPGFIETHHLPYLYNASELFIYPSFYEGFGLPPLEAMACGIPVICSNVTSIPEVVGDAAYLINPSNVDDLYNAMLEVLTNKPLREKLILKSIVRNASFTWRETARNTLKAYSKVYNKL